MNCINNNNNNNNNDFRALKISQGKVGTLNVWGGKLIPFRLRIYAVTTVLKPTGIGTTNANIVVER